MVPGFRGLFFVVNITPPLQLHLLQTLFSLLFPWFSKFCFVASSFLLCMSYNPSTESGSYTSGPPFSFPDETTSGDFVWEAMHEEEMKEVNLSISQSQSVKK